MSVSKGPLSNAVNRFKIEFQEFQIENAGAITLMEKTIATHGGGDALSQFFWEMVTDLKGILGAAAASDCTGRDYAKKGAASAAESWVGRNTPALVPLALWMRGVEVGSSEIVAGLEAT
jgi:hypothetical protein